MIRRSNLLRFLTPLLCLCWLSGLSQVTGTTPARKDTLLPATPAVIQEQIRRNRITLDSVRKHRDSTLVQFFTGDFEKYGTPELHPIDTSLTGFENYNRLYRQSRFYATLGNIGQASRPLSPFPFFRQSGFDYGIHTFDAYLYQNDSVRFYKVVKTYSELFYVQAPNKELNFRAVFSRNIYRSLNMGFDFGVLSSPGAYLRQRTNQVNFAITSQFFTKNKRYGMVASFVYNRLRNYDNGGIKNDSLFENNIETNRQVIAVNLETARTNIRESGFFMKHYFNLSGHTAPGKDTTRTRKGFELGRLIYSFRYDRQTMNFIDNQPDSGFFPPPVLDTVKTFDSVVITKYVNDLVWSNPSFNTGKELRVMRLEAGIRQQYAEVDLYGKKNTFNQFIPHAGIDFNPFPSIRLQAQGDYVLGTYNKDDLSLNVILSTILGKKARNAGIISLTGHYALQKPAWFYEHYEGNSYRWDTAWHKQTLISGGFSYSLKFLEAGVNLARLTNFVYLDTTGRPRQEKDQFGYMNLYLNTYLDFWRFTLRSQLSYQTVQGTTILRVPAFMGNVSLYFTRVLLHGAATLQPGLNFFYNTRYFADNYNPATRSFYLQDRKETGDYLYMDIFVNLKIQRARFFVAYSHFNASFMKHTYYTTPSYPMQDGAFKFGISWRFHD